MLLHAYLNFVLCVFFFVFVLGLATTQNWR
jgi:hypothetical protein